MTMRFFMNKEVLLERIKVLKHKLNMHYAIRKSNQVDKKFELYVEQETIRLTLELKQLEVERVAS